MFAVKRHSRVQIIKSLQNSSVLCQRINISRSKHIKHYEKNEFNLVPSIEKCSAASLLSAAMITTNAGYTMSPLLLTTLSNAPLVAFGCIQIAGLAPIKQIYREKETGDLSPFPFISLFTNCSIWTTYGLILHDETIIIANGIGAIFGVAYTAYFAKHTHISMSKYYVGSLGILSFILSSPLWLGIETGTQLIGLSGSIGAFVLVASPLAVIRTVIQQKSTKAMPFPLSAAMTFTACSWFSYGWFVLNDPFIWVPNTFGMASGVLQLALFAIY